MADKKFTLTFDVEGNIGPIKGAIQEFQSVIKRTDLKIPVGISGNIDKVIGKLNAEIEEFESITAQGFTNMGDISKAEKSFGRISSLMRQLGDYGRQIRGIDPKKFLPKEVIERTEKLERAFEKLSDVSLADKANTKKIEAQTEAIRKQQEEVDKLRTKYDTLAAENKTAGARKGNLTSSIKAKEKEAEAIRQQMEALEKVKGGKSSAEYQKLNADFKALTKTIRSQKDEFNSLDATINKNKTVMSGLKVQIDGAESSLSDMQQQLKLLQTNAGSSQELEELRKELAQLTQTDISEIPTDLEQLKKIIDSLASKPLEKIETSMEEIEGAAAGMTPTIKQAAKSLDELGQEGKELTRTGQEIENLKNQVLDFFSITNTIQIFKNAIRDAFETVKELDTAMTETAVVTDFSVGDMWDKLPEYSDQATKLGTSIKSLYEATTLYYQQGLQSNEAMSVGIETMKMARIANMDAAQATEAMTAALRGFNMEINETSATRINDVYSELAAITASDTEQIATAMSKTASIAASANMEFETTAALLAQIIETTQEAPETAGTAMKTIIARFTEVKQLFSEGMLTGEDSEGEEININKIDAALKTVGISLKDFLNGTKGIDDIFLELASKWDSLDLATQRYIATTAAGSRQQSRFIAMMSNYDRTMELVTAANNSAGASQKQFDKTLESLDAKLQRLNNAWQEFTMGLANNEVIKVGVDLLTSLLETINKITGVAGTGGIGGLITMLLRLGTVIGALKGGEAIFNSLLKSLANKGFKILDVTKINELKGVGDAFESLKKGSDILKDPALRGEAFKTLGANVKGAGQALWGVFKKFGGWIALVLALGAAINALVKSFQGAQKSAKMEGLQESLTNLQNEADAAKTELSEIGSAEKNLDSLQDTLDGLVRGTDEWKQALIAVNQEVLGLIDKYPDLANYLSTGEHGQLTIDQAGWDKLYQDQQELIINLTNVQNATTAQIKELQAAMDFDEFVIEIQETDANKILTEAELQISDWMDSEVGGSGVTVGDMSAAIIDGYNSQQIQGQIFADAFLDMLGISHAEPPPTMSEINNSIKENGGYAADTQRSKTGGLTQKEYTALAAAFAEEGIYLSDGMTDDERTRAEQIYGDFGFDMDFFDPVIDAAIEVGRDFDELGAASLALATQQEQAVGSFIRNALNGQEELSNINYGDAITEFMAETTQYENLTELIDAEKELILEQKSKDEIMQEYAETFGKYYADGKLYSDSSMANEIDLSEEYMANALASAHITVQVQQDALEIIQSGLKGKDTGLFDKLFSADGAEITSEDIAKYMGVDGLDAEQIAKDMGYENLQDMANKLGVTVEDLSKTLTQNFDSAIDRITKQRKDLTRQMSRYSKGDFEGYEINAAVLAALEQKFGEQIRYTLENVISSLEGTGDDALISAGYEQFRNVAMTGSEWDVHQLASFVEDIDWSNPIDAVYRLNKEIETGSGLTKDYAQGMMDVGSSFFGAGSQMQYFINSSEYVEGLSGDLDEIIEKNEEISASDILDLADDYKTLDKIMKNTGATAGGLAEALQKIQDGELGLYQLTDAVMASLTGFDSLNSLVADTLKTLENFDPGMDENQVADFVNTAYETISENLKAGAVGNTQNFSYLDFLFPGWREGLSGDELVAQMEYLTGQLEKNATNMRQSWSDLAAGKDVYGNAISFDEGRTADDLSIIDTGSEIQFTGWEGQGMTTNDMIAWIADAYNVSDNYARMMLADFKNYSADLAYELNENDYAAGIEAAYEELRETTVYKPGSFDGIYYDDGIGYGQKLIDESEIQAIANLYNKTFDEVYAEFANRGALITDFYDENGMLQETDVILSQLNTVARSGGDVGADWVDQFMDNVTGNLNIDELNEGLAGVGIPESARAGITQDIVDSIAAGTEGGTAQIDVTLSDGSTQTLTITPDIDVATAIANAETDLQNSKLAEAITQAFSNVTISPQVDSENLTGYIVAAIKAADGTTVVAVPDQASLDNITASINGAADAANPYVRVNSNVNSIISSINSISRTVYVTVQYQEKNKPSTVDSTSSSSSSTNDNSAYWSTRAKGIKNAPHAETSLVSEEGPELIQKANGTAYLSGTQGPEIANIEKGDTVYTAEETEDIFKKRSHDTIPRYASGYGYGDAYGGGKSGGRSSDDDEETWENPFDKLYNLVRKIDEELRQRERIERRYEKLLEGINTSANKIIAVSREELAQLEKERMLQEQLIAGRKGQISQYQSENADLTKYANVTQDENGNSVLRINWDLIDQVTDTEQGERIEEYVAQLEEWFDSLEEAEDALWDIEDAVEEIKERGEEEYFELEDAIKEALTQTYQDEIDKLSEINNSINETNSSLLDAIQSSIDKQRQDRDNQRTEEDLAEKQRRLLYLQQDTSGANAMEILQLQDEIAQGQEDYTDTLIDQKISELQEQNDKAAEQRDQQITLLQAQLDHYIESGRIWNEVYALMDEGLDKDNGLIRGSRLEQILQNAQNFSGLSAIGQQEWWKDMNTMIAQALAYLEVGRQLEDIGVQAGTQIEFTTQDGRTITGTVDAEGNVTGSDGQTYNNVFQGADGKYYAGENIAEVEEPEVEEPNPGSSSDNSSSNQPTKKNNPYGVASEQGNYYYAKSGKTTWGGNSVKAIQWALNDMGYRSGAIDGGYGYNTYSAVKRFQAAEGLAADGDYGPNTREKMRLRGYNQGGLADFTGPAWLDGTKARPEIVLDAQDSRNFIQLRDILSSILNRGGINTSTENNGDITYDIDINVESIGSDYDIEQVANKVKSLIGDDARYRNNNTVSLKR